MILRILLIMFFTLAGFDQASPAQESWQEYRCQHFIIYYKDVPQDFLKSVEEMAEYYYQEITHNLGFSRYESWSWDKRAKIYIYRDQDDYVNSSKQAGWSSGAALIREKTIRTFPSANGFFDSVLPHELGHIIFRELIGIHAETPPWFDEGVAMYQEKAKRWGANNVVKKMIEEKKFIPLRELTDMRLSSDTPRDIVDLYYVEAASVVYYLISEEGQFKFSIFCKRLKEGSQFGQALRSAYIRFRSIDELNSAWVNYLQR